MPRDWQIRMGETSVVEEIIRFDHIAVKCASRREFIERWVEAGRCFVAVSDGRVAGYGVLEYTFYAHGFVAMLYVAERFRGLGIGAALMGRLERECRTDKIFTSTNESNLAMQGTAWEAGF